LQRLRESGNGAPPLIAAQEDFPQDLTATFKLKAISEIT